MTVLPNRNIVRASRSSAVRTEAQVATRSAVERLEDRRLFTVSLLSAIATPISSTPTGDPAAPVIADFDGDTKLDVLVAFPAPSAIASGFIQFGKGDGAGGFAFSTAVDVGIFTGRPVVGDFNNDDLLDIAVTNAFGGEVKVIRGNGNGTFGSISAFAAGVSPEALAAADFNADGFSDLVAGNRSGNSVSVYLGNGTTTLGAATTINTATDPATLAIADFTQDGKLDILVGASGGQGSANGVLQVFTGRADGTFDTTPVATLGPRGVTAVADIDSDNGPDVIIGVSDKDKAVASLNGGIGTFSAVPGSPTSGATKAAVAADMDGDSTTDLVTAVNGRIDILTGNGNGTFAKAVLFDAAGGSGPAVADLNGDGRGDVLTIAAVSGQTANRTLNVSLGRRIGPDLSVAIVSAIPTAALTSQNSDLVVRVTNTGNAKVSETVTLQLYTSEDTTIDDNDALLTQAFPKLNLAPGKSKTFKLKFAFGLTPGVFNLISRVDPSGATGDLNLADNTAISSSTVTVGQAFIDLSAAMPVSPTGTILAANTAKFEIRATNVGNVPAKGRVSFSVVASADAEITEDVDLLLRTKLVNVKLNPGQTKSVKFSIKLAGLPAGSYFFIAAIDQGNAFVDADVSNNVAAGSAPVTVQ
ncbi:FG-GAP-like repeat-containing protein [Humisphaera borealis]|uniref:VCBS repeat-containing protein n=1 Tax=Humisphaera borealis TaxID=2807512 RepID=A0A7M2WTZ3_9BACT|nr:FG-GAP-like repeat-containing protein [Humisphaera borealis]QOV88995.1 VCBS repeat-containing protein [Humisphaera borealis]